MNNDLDNKEQDIDEAVGERNAELHAQRRYYERLHFIELYPLNTEAYYESLKDWSSFKEPKDTSRKDAEKDAGISGIHKVKALFSPESRSKAEILQKEYSDKFSERVERMRKQYYKRQEESNKTIELKKEKLIMHDSTEVLEFFKFVLECDEFTLDMLGRNEPYQKDILMKRYDSKLGVLSYSYRIPNSEEVCVIDRFYYDEKKNNIKSRDLDKTRIRNIRLKAARAILLRSAAMVYNSDAYENVKSIHITGFLSYYDSAFGTKRNVDAIRFEISKEVFKQINLERVKLSELFDRVLKAKEVAGLYSKKPYELQEVK